MNLTAEDPITAFHTLSLKLREARTPHVVATVIEVFGSSSARVGSKAIFDGQGNNLVGWVGGGCAEQHVAQQSIEALGENRSRIIEADLDDELYGLGVACGGKMNLFLEPVQPAEQIEIETPHPREAELFGVRYGWEVRAHTEMNKGSENTAQSDLRELLLTLCQAIAKKRDKTGMSLRNLKGVPVHYASQKIQSESKRVILIGGTRITESLKEHFELLGFMVICVGPLLTPYGKENDAPVQFETGDRVVIASHTSQDTHIVAKVLKAKVAYVAMVGSRKRALEVMKILKIEDEQTIMAPLYVPAGFDIDARNPEEVALSIVCECLSVN